MSISIWDYEKPLDAMMLSHDHIAMLVMKHDQQIKDLTAHLLELKQLITPMMEFKRREWVGLTKEDRKDILSQCEDEDRGYVAAMAEAILREKNGL